MKVNPYIFRGYDLRGLVDIDLSPELAEHLGKAHGTSLVKQGITKAVIGYDCRATSEEYAAAVAKGLTWAGVDVIDIGMTMVGTFYWSQYFLESKGGVFITASHNPPQYNGFKFANDYSETLVSDGIQALRRMVENEEYVPGARVGTVIHRDIRNEYFADLLRRCPVPKKFRVVVDPSCATGAVIVPELLRQAGCDVVEKNTTIDSSFPLGTPDPIDRHVMDRVSRETLDEKADLGLTYDTDGDRVGVVDEKGNVIWNDVLLAVIAADVLSRHPGSTIMYNTLCSKLVAETITQNGGTPFMWRTGHSFLKKKNQEVKGAFIGELSGHFFFSVDFYNHDDGAYSTLRLLNYLARVGKPLSELVAELPLYVSSPEIKLVCADDKKIALIEKVKDVLRKDFLNADIIDDERAGDGMRLETHDSMFVIRYSQNGPYITVKFEGKTQARHDELKKYINELLHRFPEISWVDPLNANTEALV